MHVLCMHVKKKTAGTGIGAGVNSVGSLPRGGGRTGAAMT